MVTARKYIAALLVLMLSAVFGTTVYAWLSIASINKVEDLIISASLRQDLEISLDGVTYGDKLDSDYMTNLLKGYGLGNATTNDLINFSEIEGVGVSAGGVIKLPVWFRTSALERNIYLTDNETNDVNYSSPTNTGTFAVSRGVPWRPDVNYLYEPGVVITPGETRTYYAQNAIRFGFKEEKITTNPNDDRLNSDLSTLIVDPSKNKNRGYGEAFGAYDYYKNSKDPTIVLPATKPDTVFDFTTFRKSNPYIAENDNTKIMQLMKTEQMDPNHENRNFYVGKVMVFIWLEGWDADMFDSILSDKLKVQLCFKAGRNE